MRMRKDPVFRIDQPVMDGPARRRLVRAIDHGTPLALLEKRSAGPRTSSSASTSRRPAPLPNLKPKLEGYTYNLS